MPVAVAPSFSKRIHSLDVLLGSPAKFSCKVDGEPRPTVTWSVEYAVHVVFRRCVQINLLTYLHLAAQYLSDDCQLVADTSRRRLRSSGNFKCTLTGTSTRLGDQALAAAGPRLWNDLPAQVRRPDLSLDTFRQKLKAYLFVRGTGA